MRALRTVFCVLLLLSSALAFQAPATERKIPQPPPPLDGAQWLRSGPMLGHSAHTETVIWLQTLVPSRALVRYWPVHDPMHPSISEEISTTGAGDHIARFLLTGLAYGTRYEYEVYLNGHRVQLPFSTGFQTQPIWQYRTDPPDFKLAFGSCYYLPDAPYDRPGNPYGGGFEIFRAITATQPDAFLWIGDNLYFREGDFGSEAMKRRRYALSRELPELRELLANSHNYATWDDHDFGPNDSGRTYADKDVSLRLFKEYWANPAYGFEETPGVFGSFQWGDAEFFLLDDRYHRTPDTLPDAASREMLGSAQLQWLKQALQASRSTFKIIANGSQLLNPLMADEAFGKYPREQTELLDFIRDARIEGVLFLSGDRHAAELIRLERPGMYPLYDFTSSPLTAGLSSRKEYDNPARIAGTYVDKSRNFGVLEFSGTRNDRTLTLRLLDPQGKELWVHSIKANDLRWPKP